MISKPDKNKLRQKRHTRVRGKISGTSETPRLNVFRSNTNIYAQVIDDVTGTTLASASSLKLTGTKTEQAAEVGKLVAEAAKAKELLELYQYRNLRDRYGHQQQQVLQSEDDVHL